MSPEATILLTLAFVYAFVGAYNLLLHARRYARGQITFALFCLALAVLSIGLAAATDAKRSEDATLAFEATLAGGFLAGAFFIDFASAILERFRSRYVFFGYALGISGGAASLLGFVVRPLASTSPQVSVFGTVIMVAMLTANTWQIGRVLWASRERPDLRLITLGALFGLGGGSLEVLAWSLERESPGLLQYLGLSQVVAVSLFYLRRFVNAADTLRSRTTELSEAYGHLEVAHEELLRQNQLAAIGSLSAVIAHEVRNPLAILRNATSSLKRPSLGSADRTMLQDICREEVIRLTRLASDLLDYASPPSPEGANIDLARLVQAALTRIRESSPHRQNLHYEVIDRGVSSVRADPTLLKKAIEHLVDNAIAAMPGGGRVSVSTYRTDHKRRPHVVIEVTDNGPGMPPEVIDRARDPFFTTRPAGTGLGLAIVGRFVESHDGELQLTTRPAGGTVARILIPLRRASTLPPAPPPP